MVYIYKIKKGKENVRVASPTIKVALKDANKAQLREIFNMGLGLVEQTIREDAKTDTHRSKKAKKKA